jgi:thiol-disulfide isomerase/thioredoxin
MPGVLGVVRVAGVQRRNSALRLRAAPLSSLVVQSELNAGTRLRRSLSNPKAIMAFNPADLFPGATTLLKNGSQPVPISELSSADVIGLYFSAHWCGPCRGFTPVLSKIYTDLKAAGKAFEIVFVSADRDESSMKSYFEDMPWLALQWADKKNLEEELDNKYAERPLLSPRLLPLLCKSNAMHMYECEGIPHLVLIDAKSGDVITLEGRSAVMPGADAFPFTPAAIAAAIKKKSSSVLGELKAWSAVGSDVASLQAHEAVAIFIGNSENNAKHVAPALIQASGKLGARLKVFFLPYLVENSASQAEFEAKFPSSWTVLPQSTATDLAKVNPLELSASTHPALTLAPRPSSKHWMMTPTSRCCWS